MSGGSVELERLMILAHGTSLDRPVWTLAWLDALAWYWACLHLLNGGSSARDCAEAYCIEYLRMLEAGKVRP